MFFKHPTTTYIFALTYPLSLRDALWMLHLDLWRRRLRMDRLLDQSNLFST
eukprot:COSAG02_NODE_58926_length_276_cov_0.457627_1_plen_50_part_01